MGKASPADNVDRAHLGGLLKEGSRGPLSWYIINRREDRIWSPNAVLSPIGQYPKMAVARLREWYNPLVKQRPKGRAGRFSPSAFPDFICPQPLRDRIQAS